MRQQQLLSSNFQTVQQQARIDKYVNIKSKSAVYSHHFQCLTPGREPSTQQRFREMPLRSVAVYPIRHYSPNPDRAAHNPSHAISTTDIRQPPTQDTLSRKQTERPTNSVLTQISLLISQHTWDGVLKNHNCVVPRYPQRGTQHSHSSYTPAGRSDQYNTQLRVHNSNEIDERGAPAHTRQAADQHCFPPSGWDTIKQKPITSGSRKESASDSRHH
ncbi:hypothetical protein Tco_1015329 [Tanacetum coccineum]|uniref:Uncharacterized protein n=1 Tax=Tanacetum coccineum TaxID=301880 RepID=A0ABQ5FL73_9ASTR